MLNRALAVMKLCLPGGPAHNAPRWRGDERLPEWAGKENNSHFNGQNEWNPEIPSVHTALNKGVMNTFLQACRKWKCLWKGHFTAPHAGRDLAWPSSTELQESPAAILDNWTVAMKMRFALLPTLALLLQLLQLLLFFRIKMWGKCLYWI